MQAQWVHGSGDIVDLRAPSLNSENVESSVLGSLESSSELEALSNIESEEENIENHLERGVGNQEANNDASSVASSLHNREHYDESDEDRNSPCIFDERYDEVNEDETGHPDNVQPAGYYLKPSSFIEVTAPLNSDSQAFASGEQVFAKLLGLIKKEFYNRITISDDRSAGSKIEERNLLALRGRETKTQEREARPSSPNYSYYPTGTENRPLQDYQLQLQMLRQAQIQERKLEQDKKEKPMMARQELKQNQELEHVPSNNSAAMDVNAIASDIKQVLDQADPSKVDLQKLQDYIELLQAQAWEFKSIQSRPAPSRYQIIYRIQRLEPVQQQNGKKWEKRYVPFFDRPERVRGHGTASDIKSNLPLTNFELYLEKNKDISFIVYRNFDLESAPGANASGIDNGNDEFAHRPHHANETVRLVNKDLIGAIKALLGSQQHYAELAYAFSVSLELPAPYLFIYHSRKNLEKLRNSLSMHAKAELSLLFNYVMEQYADEYATADSLLSQNKISSKLLRYLFKPGDLLISRVDGQYKGYVSTSWPKISKSKEVSSMGAATSHIGSAMSLYGTQDANARMASDKITVHVCQVNVWDWGFDGNFQRQHSMLFLEIPAIEDGENDTNTKDKEKVNGQGSKPKCDMVEKNISDLNVFPMQYASAEIVDNCRRRGKTFWKCRSRSYVSYQATERDSIQNLADERYMIDLKTYRSLHPDSRYGIAELKDELGPEALARDVPPDEQFELLLPLKIKGYNLRNKKWFDLMADRISDVKWNKEAFQNLVIDRKARDLTRALVSNQLAVEKGTDLITGKGNGLILLLHGGPGTGKTLTAESVAEIAEKPLYRVTCGDVGTKAEEVEKYLESVLHLGKIWGCVVLLDEADVFLEQRSLEDMERNALVSVFLRVLEYYEGILVLTSNRVGTFDEAFKSRIQLALHYPVLGPYQRLRIWENFINRLESFGDNDKIDIADLRDHLEDLKEEKMNGRQIRNAITTARQYAEWKGNMLTYKHLSDVIEVSGRFDKYLDRLNGGFTQDQLAEDERLRLAK